MGAARHRGKARGGAACRGRGLAWSHPVARRGHTGTISRRCRGPGGRARPHARARHGAAGADRSWRAQRAGQGRSGRLGAGRASRERGVIAVSRRRRFATRPVCGSPEFAGLCDTLLQLLVERHLNLAAARRREARKAVMCANPAARGRYRVAPSPHTFQNCVVVSRINIPPFGNACTFHVAPGCSLIHDWTQPPGTGAMGAGDCQPVPRTLRPHPMSEHSARLRDAAC